MVIFLKAQLQYSLNLFQDLKFFFYRLILKLRNLQVFQFLAEELKHFHLKSILPDKMTIFLGYIELEFFLVFCLLHHQGCLQENLGL